MHILKNTFLYTLLAIFISAGAVVVALSPGDANAQSMICSIVMDEPAGATVNEPSDIFEIDVYCDRTAQYTIYNETDGEVIYGPQRIYTWGSQTSIGEFYTDEHHHKEFRHTFDSTGQKTIRAALYTDGNDPVDYGSVGVVPQDGGGSCSLDDVDIDGPSNVSISDDDGGGLLGIGGTSVYSADFDYSGSSVDYRFFIQGEWSGPERTTSGDGASQGINWSSYGEGTYRVCVNANACGDSQGSCMNVQVEEGDISGCTDPDATNYDPDATNDDGSCEYDTPPPTEDEDATLRVRSDNPDSGVSISSQSGNVDGGNTSYNITRSGDISGELRVNNLDNFSHWEGCNSTNSTQNRDCVISVNEGNTKTVTAVFDGGSPPPPPGTATIRVRSQNPSSGVSISVDGGNLQGGSTSYNIEENYDLSGQLRVDDLSNFSHWEGCDGTNSTQNRDCVISANTGETETVTAVYDGSPPPPPGTATIRVRSQNPSSGVSISVDGGNLQGGSTSYNIEENYDLSGQLRAPLDNFSHWEGCDGTNSTQNRDCVISANTGETETVTAVFGSDPGNPGCTDPDANNYDPNADYDDGSCTYNPSQAVLNVYSSNPSSGASLTVTSNPSGNLPSNFYTQETFERGEEIVARIWARDTHDGSASGNPFDHWEGCDSGSTNDRACDVAVGVGSSQSITAYYDDGDPTTGCTDPSANNYDPNATVDDGSCEYGGTTLRVRSDNPNSGVDITRVSGNVQSGTTASDSYDINISSGSITGTLEAEANAGGNTFDHWEGNCEPSSSGRQCDVNIADGTSRTVIAVYDEVSGPPPTIDNFRVANSPNVDFSVDPPQVFVGETYELIWSTSNADTVTATGDWSDLGSKSSSGSDYENQSSISGSEETFSYTLTAENSAGTAEETVEITVIDPPRFDLDSDAEADIQGSPGSSANVGVSVTSENYSGTVELEVDPEDIPESLKDDEGNAKISFSFADEQIDTAGNTSLFIEVLQPIYENLSKTITITGTDLSGTADPEVEYTEFVLNLYGFGRTIEEF